MALYHTRGFSLIEVTIAVAIIAVMVVTTSTLLNRLPVSGREVRDQDIALKVARNEIESLRALGYASLPTSGPFTNMLLSSFASSSASVTITDFNAKTKQVVVNVFWQSSTLTTRSVSLATLITQNSGLQ